MDLSYNIKEIKTIFFFVEVEGFRTNIFFFGRKMVLKVTFTA